MKFVQWISCVAIAVVLAGCASSKSGEVYSRDQAQKAHTVELGLVEFVKEVRVEGSRSGGGAAVGGVAGGFAGSTVGGGKGSTLASIGGALLGAAIGAKAEEKLSEFDGLEITVKLDSGKVLAIVQEADVLFAVGDRVRVLTGPDGTVRVEK
jgi:outer membrane lipoprotein SlyB